MVKKVKKVRGIKKVRGARRGGIRGDSEEIVKKILQVEEPVRTFKKPKVKVIEPSVLLKTFKFIGYCKCGCQVGSQDLESKFIYRCPGCSKRARTKKLSREKVGERPVSRRDYMEATVNSEHLEAPYISNEEVPPEILKKFQEED